MASTWVSGPWQRNTSRGTLSVKEIYVARLGAVGHIDAGCQKLFLEHRFLIGIRRGDDDANLNV